jgi:hypothetical protein
LRAWGCPSDNNLRAIIRRNSVRDCPIVENDVKLAEQIFGKDIAIIKGKTMCKKPAIVLHDTISIPPELKMAQRDVTLAIDSFYVNKMVFFHTISEAIHYRTTQWIPDRETDTYKHALTVVLKMYKSAGFNVAFIHADLEFDPVLTLMKQNYDFDKIIAPTNKHVPTVERSIHTVKERIRATLHGNPYKALPRVILSLSYRSVRAYLTFFHRKVDAEFIIALERYYITLN